MAIPLFMFSVVVRRNDRALLLALGVMIALICMATALANFPTGATPIFNYDGFTGLPGTKLESGNCVIHSRYSTSRDETQVRLYTMNPERLVELITVHSAIEDADKP